MPDNNLLSPMSVLREAITAVPAVKYALGIGGMLGALALIYVFQINPRVAFVGLIILFVFMGVLVLFARAAALTGAIAWPALIFTWFVLLMFIATTVTLFTSVFFQKPVDLQNWITGKASAASSIPDIPNADSGWIGGESSPNGYCDPVLAALKVKYPSVEISMTLLPEQHRSEYTPFKHDYYRYQCAFRASEK